jgi:hypothetical protein
MDEFEIPEGVDLDAIEVYLVEHSRVSAIVPLSNMVNTALSDIDSTDDDSVGARKMIRDILAAIDTTVSWAQYLALFLDFDPEKDTDRYIKRFNYSLRVWQIINDADHPKNQFQ